MPKVSPIQRAFNAGEFSPLMYGRQDFEKYQSALAVCLNHIPLLQGPVTRRPGTVFVSNAKSPTTTTRLQRFEFSTTQAYILEFGDQYIRVYRNHAQIETSPGVPVEIATPYAPADLFALKFVQSADVLYITHPSYQPRKLTRTSHTSWTLSLITFLDGPYLSTNTTTTTLTPAAATGTGINLTASSTNGINNGAGFQSSTDVGRLVRLKNGATWGYATITSVTSPTVAVVTINSAFAAATATTTWRLGIWSNGLGWPRAVTFFEDRLCLAGANYAPSRADGSNTGDYENFAPSALDGTVTDSHAWAYTLNSNDVQIIQWLLDDENGLMAGTPSGEWLIRASTLEEAVTPTNINAKQKSNVGSADIQALRAKKAALFVQRAARKVHEFTFVYTENGFRTPDMTKLAEHITTGGVTSMAYQKQPQSIIWAPRNDGLLLGFSYDRDEGVVGWHRHQVGGYSDAAHTLNAIVDSVAVIPEPGGKYDEVWLAVRRYVNGATVRQIEYMTKVWESGDTQDTAVYVDAAMVYSGAPATVITGVTHLRNETVSVLVDGAAHPDKVVSGTGEITLDRPGSNVVIGLPYNSDGQALRLDVGAADGTAIGKTQRSHKVGFLLHDSLGLSVGPSFDELEELIFRTSGMATNMKVPLFSGVKDDFSWPGDYTTDNYVCWRWARPFPGTVVAIMPKLHTQDA